MPDFLDRLRGLPLFADDTSRELRTWQWLSIIALGVALLLPLGAVDVSICVFYNMTGLPCPGCGLSRSLHSFVHLQPGHALMYHPLGFFGALGAVFFTLTAVWRAPGRLFERYKHHTAFAMGVLAVALIVFAIVRIVWISVDPQSPLAIVLMERRLDWQGARGLLRLLGY